MAEVNETTTVEQALETEQNPRTEQHVFVPGVWLWGQRLCAGPCYRPFYYACHGPSFGHREQQERNR